MSGLTDFYIIFGKFQKTLLLSVGGASAMPLMATLAGIDPPWPPRIAIFTSIAIFVVIIFLFQLLYRSSRQKVNRIMRLGLYLLIFGIIAYLILFSIFVIEIPTTKEKIFAGCGWTTNAKSIAASFLADPESGCPGQYEKLLEGAEYENRVIWDAQGIALVRLATFITWIASFVGLAIVTGAFVIFQHNYSSRRAKRRND